MVLLIRATSVALSVLQMALYARLGSNADFLNATTALLAVGVCLTISDPGFGLLISEAASRQDHHFQRRLVSLRIGLSAGAMAVALALIPAPRRAHLLALLGFWAAFLVRHVAMAILRVRSHSLYEFSRASVLNSVDTLVAIVALVGLSSVFASLCAYSASALLTTGIVVRDLRAFPPAQPAGGSPPSVASPSILTRVVRGTPAFATGLYPRLAGLAVASVGIGNVRTTALLAGALRLVDALFLMLVSYVVVPAYVDRLVASTATTRRRTAARLAPVALALAPLPAALVLDPSIVKDALAPLLLIGLLVAATFCLSHEAHLATATPTATLAIAPAMWPLVVMPVSAFFGVTSMFVAVTTATILAAVIVRIRRRHSEAASQTTDTGNRVGSP